MLETVAVPSPTLIVVTSGHKASTCDAVTTPPLTLNAVPTNPDPGFERLEQETGSTEFSTLDVTGPGSGLAAVVVGGAAVSAGADLTTVGVLA